MHFSIIGGSERMKVLLKEYIHPEAKALLIKHAELTDDIDDIASVDAIILR